MSPPVRRVRVGRVVVRGSAIDRHDMANLSRLVAAELERPTGPAEPAGPVRGPRQIAARIAHRVRASTEESPR